MKNFKKIPKIKPKCYCQFCVKLRKNKKQSYETFPQKKNLAN